MNILIIGISFILIWLGTTFFILRYVKKLKNDLLKKSSDTEKPSEENSENYECTTKKKLIKPFEIINSVDPNHFLFCIQQEHPQIIALVLSYLDADKASVILQKLPSYIQSDVSRRIATMDHVSTDIIVEIDRVLEKKLSSISILQIGGEEAEYFPPGGVESAVEILNRVNRNSKNQIIRELEDEDPELAEELKKRSITLRNSCGKFFKIFHSIGI